MMLGREIGKMMGMGKGMKERGTRLERREFREVMWIQVSVKYTVQMGQYTSKHYKTTTKPVVDDEIGIVDTKVIVIGSGNFGTCLADHLASLSLFNL